MLRSLRTDFKVGSAFRGAWASPSPRRVALFVLVSLALTAPGPRPGESLRTLHAQSPVLGLTDLQSPRITEEASPFLLARSALPARLLSQEGIGGSVIDLVDRSGSANAIDLSLVRKSTAERTVVSRALDADGAGRIRLADEPATVRGTYTGAIQGAGALAASARTIWPNQASTAYMAEEAARDLVLPMLIVNQDDHSTIFSVFNPSEDEIAQVTIFVFDPANGALLTTFASPIEPGAVSSWDTFFDSATFGPNTLPPNAAGGFVGSLFIESSHPVVGLAYGEQIAKLGSAALGARPRAAASTTQILPWVREDPTGDALIAIVAGDMGASPTEVTVTFMPEAGSAGEVEPFDVAFTLSPRGTAYLDPGGHGRGTVEIPNMPEVFQGSVIVEADHPVLAANLERQHDDERDIIFSAAAYNAFAPEELSAGFEVPTLRRQTDYRSSVLHLLNPDSAEAALTVELRDGEGTVADTIEQRLAAGAGLRLDLSGLEAMPRGYGSASITADRPIAALVGEQRDTSVSYPLPPVEFGMGPSFGSDVRGSAKITQVGDDIEVVVNLETDSPITLAIIEGPCSDDDARRLHTLQTSAPRRSTTTVRNVSLIELSETPHAIRGWRRNRRRVCGNIPAIFDEDDADASLVRALPARYTPPTAPPEPTPTATPDAPPTDVPTATPEAPPTQNPGTSDAPTIYLPITRHDAG